jgi:hypothetical protein
MPRQSPSTGAVIRLFAEGAVPTDRKHAKARVQAAGPPTHACVCNAADAPATRHFPFSGIQPSPAARTTLPVPLRSRSERLASAFGRLRKCATALAGPDIDDRNVAFGIVPCEPADRPKRSSRSWTSRDSFPRNEITHSASVA